MLSSCICTLVDCDPVDVSYTAGYYRKSQLIKPSVQHHVLGHDISKRKHPPILDTFYIPDFFSIGDVCESNLTAGQCPRIKCVRIMGFHVCLFYIFIVVHTRGADIVGDVDWWYIWEAGSTRRPELSTAGWYSSIKPTGKQQGCHGCTDRAILSGTSSVTRDISFLFRSS